MNKKGVSLTEVLIVIVIMGIITTIATPLVFNIIDNIKKQAFVNDLYAIKEAARVFTVSEGLDSGIFREELYPYLAKDFSNYQEFSVKKENNDYYVNLKNDYFETVMIYYENNKFYYEQTYIQIDQESPNFVVKNQK